jgi:hypothetical protein
MRGAVATSANRVESVLSGGWWESYREGMRVLGVGEVVIDCVSRSDRDER